MDDHVYRGDRLKREIGDFGFAGMQGDGYGFREILCAGEKCNGIHDVQLRLSVRYFLECRLPRRIDLLDTLVRHPLRVPGVGGHTHEIYAGQQVAKAIVAPIIRGDLALPPG